MKMTGYHHPIVHQMPDMAFKFALMQEVKHRTPHREALPETMYVVRIKFDKQMYEEGERINIRETPFACGSLFPKHKFRESYYHENPDVTEFWIRNEQKMDSVIFSIEQRRWRLLIKTVIGDISHSLIKRSSWVFKYVDQEQISLRTKMMFLVTDDKYRQKRLQAKDKLAHALYTATGEEKENEQVPFELMKIIHETVKWEEV